VHVTFGYVAGYKLRSRFVGSRFAVGFTFYVWSVSFGYGYTRLRSHLFTRLRLVGCLFVVTYTQFTPRLRLFVHHTCVGYHVYVARTFAR